MTQTPGSAMQSDLFFESLINSYVTNNPRFLRRDWLAAEVEARMAEPDCRFVLLTAEPGAGKTAFMAQLAKDHPTWPRYFIRRDQRTPLEDGSARGFLEKIGFQFAALYPQAFQTDALRISISQMAATSSGQITGADVDTLIASPFYSKAVDIIQEVKANQGNLTGIRVRKLVTDPAQISLLDLQRMAILAPALALQQQGHTEPIVILIDALDELRYRPVGDTVLDWLTQCPELPDNLRIVVTSRPDREWLAAFHSNQRDRLLEQTIPSGGENIRKDLTEYARRLTAIPQMAMSLAANKTAEQSEQACQDEFVEAAVEKAKGNLGYLDAIGRAIDQAIASSDQALLEGLLEFKQLPDTLQDLYGHFLMLLRQTVGDQKVVVEDPISQEQGLVSAWTNVYRPVLGVLAVAMEPLEPSQIRRLGRMLAGEDEVSEAIGRLLQFLDEQEGRYTFYHATLPEFLLAESTRQNPQYRDLAVDPAVWHGKIVASYRGKAATWNQVDWRECDLYGIRHLTAHLDAAGQLDALRQLLACETVEHRNAWYVAKELHGDMAGYRADIQRVWSVAETDYARQRSPTALGQQCRYALMVASFNSLAASLAPVLLLALVEAQVWAPDRALAYVSAKPSAAERSAALCRLAPRLAVALPYETLGVVTEIRDANLRVQTLAALAPYLPEPEQGHALDEALATAQALPMLPPLPDIERRGSALATVAPILARLGQPERALAIIREIADPASGSWRHPGREAYARYRAEALVATAPYLPVHLLPDALTIFQALESNDAKVKVLTGLAAYLPPDLLQTAAALASALVEYDTTDVDAQIRALSGLAPYLPSSERQQAMQRALALLAAQPTSFPLSYYETRRAEHLDRLAPYLGDEMLAQALRLAYAMETPEAKASALAAIGPRLLEPERSHAIQEAIAAAHGVDTATLANVAIRLPDPERTKVLGETIAEARTIQSDRDRAQVLLILVDHLSHPLLREALRVAQDLGAEVQAEIAFRLPEPERSQALHDIATAAQTIRDTEERAVALAALVPYLPGAQRTQALQDVVAAIEQMTHEQWKLAALLQLAPYLPEEFQIPVRLEPYQPEALATTHELRWMREEHLRIQVKAMDSSPLPDTEAAQALTEAQAQYPESNRAAALAELAPRLPAAMLDNVLASARSLQDGRERARLLTQLVPYLSESQQVETLRGALTAATGVDDEARVQLLNDLAGTLARLPAQVLYPLWTQHLHRSAQRSRADAVLDLAAMAPVIVALGNSDAAATTTSALQDVGRWWP